MKLALLVLATCLAACGSDERVRSAYELRAVVAPAIEALTEQIDGATSPSEPGDGPGADEAPLEEILGPLRSGNPDLRALAVEDARKLSASTVLRLAPILSDASESAECRSAVVEILAERGTPEAFEALCAVLETASESWLRARCAYRLGRAGHDALLPRLLLRLKYEKDHETAFWLADACSRFDHLAGLGALFVVWSESEDEGLRVRVAQRTNELASAHHVAGGNELLARWKAGTLEAPGPAFEPSRRLRLEAWRRIRDLGAWDLRTVDDARFVLTRFEAWIVPLLAETLHEAEVHVRIHAAQCLERMGPRAGGALDALVDGLNEPRVAPVAASALGSLGNPSAAVAIEQRLDASGDLELRVACTSALTALAQRTSLPALRRAFDAGQAFDLRQAAADGLARIDHDRGAIGFLVACLTDASADASAAESALGAWLAERAEHEALAASVLERWRALEPAPGSIPSAEELERRRAARAAIVQEFLRGPRQRTGDERAQ